MLSLKGDFLKDDVAKLVTKNNWEILTDYHFGGYAKVTKELIDFINNFKSETKINSKERFHKILNYLFGFQLMYY